MAIDKLQKQAIVSEVKGLFKTSKLTVIVNYQGLSVEQFQTLRAEANTNQITVKVIKNRLFKLAISKNLKSDLKDIENHLKGMLFYIFNSQDEIKGAQIVKKYNREFNYPLEFVCGLDANYQFITKQTLIELADMPSREELIAQVIMRLRSPINQIQTSLGNGLGQLLNNLKAHKS